MGTKGAIGIAMSWSPIQGVLPTVLDLVTEVKWKVSWRWPRPELGCKAKGKRKGAVELEFYVLSSHKWFWSFHKKIRNVKPVFIIFGDINADYITETHYKQCPDTLHE
jgi:hypothetical protein